MFDNFVESTANAQETRKKTVYLGITTVVYAVFLIAIFIWSVFSFDLAAFGQTDELAVNKLVVPIEVPDKAPPAPENTAPKQNSKANNDKQQFDVIKDPVASINRVTEPPTEISTVKNTATAVRDGVPFIEGSHDRLAEGGNLSRESVAPTGSIGIIAKGQSDDSQLNEVETAPPAPKPVKPETKNETIRSKGVVNGIATSLPKPAYPVPAKAVRAGGEVKVQIMINEEGNVVSASALSGHPLLRAAAVSAARQAKFKPTLLSEKPVKVTGVIVYNFQP